MFYKPLYFNDTDVITQKLQNFFYDQNQIDFKQCLQDYDHIKSLCPELDDQLQQLSLKVTGTYVFQTQPASIWQESGTIHTDLDKHTSPNIVLNWPVFNCKDTYMNFYNLKNNHQGTLGFTQRLQQNYQIFSKDDCELVDRLELLVPHLIDVSAPHNVSTKTENYRLILSFRFKQNPLHLWT
jgi:hypothetical protein